MLNLITCFQAEGKTVLRVRRLGNKMIATVYTDGTFSCLESRNSWDDGHSIDDVVYFASKIEHPFLKAAAVEAGIIQEGEKL